MAVSCSWVSGHRFGCSSHHEASAPPPPFHGNDPRFIAFVLNTLATVVLLVALHAAMVKPVVAQTELAGVYGRITDASGAVIVDAEVEIKNVETNVSTTVKTNSDGLYTIPSLHPGHYLVNVRKTGFRSVTVTELTLNVQDNVVRNFALQIGSVSETVTITADQLNINTTDGTVSTVVDRQFAENLPMNGRSFQSLIQLTPGVVLATNNSEDAGQFSINGQRANANYWTVDGVSANIGISAVGNVGGGLAGTLGSTSVFGGTNSLVSVDALQEFRIQTSTYAPEFGRQPGGQISIVTRSGTNQFHGTAFDYFRNDVLDANDWFANSKGLPKAQERQNDFGGTFGGPIVKDKTFFFFSYEGFRLRLPRTALTCVPDANPADPNARQNAQPAMQPYLNAFPLPNGPQCKDGSGNPIPGAFEFNASFSNPGTLDAYSLRVDHKLNDRLNVFGRYDYSPSQLTQRGEPGVAASSVFPAKITTQTGTVGALWTISPMAANDFRFNYSSTDGSSSGRFDTFGGAVPLVASPFPSPFTLQNGQLILAIDTLGTYGALDAGKSTHNQQRQINIVDGITVQKGSHSLKVGIDYRRLSPRHDSVSYLQDAIFGDIPSAQTGTVLFGTVTSTPSATFVFQNLGIFAQDTWHVVRRLTMTYGLRWDVDYVPSSKPELNAVSGFDLSNLSSLTLLPAGASPYKTKWNNFAPRIGLAYQASDRHSWQTVLRGGFGIFYDLASSEVGNLLVSPAYPFGSNKVLLGIPFGGTSTFPFSAGDAAPAPIVPPNATNGGALVAIDPNLRLPYTLQWNVAVEQGLGKQQTITISYIGAAGKRLIQTAEASFPPSGSNFAGAVLVTNAGTSDYETLQLQFQRRLLSGLQALASYSWAHSIDTASAGSLGSFSNAFSALNANANRGPSDFDVRHAFSAGLTYDVPTPKGNLFTRAILRGWSTENIIQARTALPVNVSYSFLNALSGGFSTAIRPDVVAGQPVYLYGPQYPAGKAFNPAAFTSPPLDPTTGLPVRQGNLSRNALRGFGLTQWDFAVHRDFPIHESLKLQFRAEIFNVLNHPNFGPPVGDLQSPFAINSQFGRSIQMLGQSLAGGGLGSGSFDPLYQIGGPRSIQLALKLFF